MRSGRRGGGRKGLNPTPCHVAGGGDPTSPVSGNLYLGARMVGHKDDRKGAKDRRHAETLSEGLNRGRA